MFAKQICLDLRDKNGQRCSPPLCKKALKNGVLADVSAKSNEHGGSSIVVLSSFSYPDVWVQLQGSRHLWINICNMQPYADEMLKKCCSFGSCNKTMIQSKFSSNEQSRAVAVLPVNI